MPQTHRVKLAEVAPPLVVALDVGSSGTRGNVYDARGRAVVEARVKLRHQFTTAPDGSCTLDADGVVEEIAQILDAIAAQPLPAPITAVAIDTFASSLIGLDAEGRPLTPCFTYADSRCADDVTRLRHEVDEDAYQDRTGSRFHTSYLVPRFRWLHRVFPQVMARAHRWMSLGEYVWFRLLGDTVVGTSTAAWTGMLDRRTGAWDAEALSLSGIDAGQLSPVRNPSCDFEPLAGRMTRRWRPLSDARWLPPITDGYSSNLGAGGTGPSTMVVSFSTSGAMRVLVHKMPKHVPPGLWCYRLDDHDALLGGALNDVGRALGWLQREVPLPAGTDLNEVLAADPDLPTPTVLPFFTGERSPGYGGNARAMFAGVSFATTAAHLYRGTLEGVALSFERVADQLNQVARHVDRVVVAGRVSQDLPAMPQLLADVLDRRVVPMTAKRTTLRGTALHALQVIDPDGQRAPVRLGKAVQPNPAHVEIYNRRAVEFQRLYEVAVRPPSHPPW